MKYSRIHISQQIYCSSSLNYSIQVSINNRRLELDLHNGQLIGKHKKTKKMTFPKYPQYVMGTIALALQQMADSKTFRVYEHDRDGGRRYENFRYHLSDNYIRAILSACALHIVETN